ncbi:GNAT family N-acetyltransferase [Streptomyces sp. N2-109]|uniref:GNAT family N-acetyltransferase n=1 Tax=Streptomyces gossypii TaxID=2883101 RepID=A0ABT2K373_9ACTN|nr:GNAT family protein [Streptomyces gossypii]MCT2594627.1 GNAT family N-acetyltransferase [Streptomyces gossypii]
MFAHPLTDTAELRPLEPWQARDFADFIARTRDHLAPWLPWATSITDEEGARAWLRTYADRQAADDGRICGIWLDGTLVGGILFRVFAAPAGVCEIGVWIAPEAQGRGLVHRAARHFIRWAFETRGMHRVEWRAFTTNTRSAATAERLGMTREGTLREAFPYLGTRHDIAVWSLLARDWKP